jgi:glycosyltransferase involved in cell wall biosynthesis
LLAVIQGHVDEIVVGVDSRTSDNTREIARNFDAITYDFDWPDHFGNARNLAIDHATSAWVLILDDDEIPDVEFLNALPDLASRSEFDGYKMLGRHFMDGVFIRRWYPSWHIRLFRSHCRYDGRVHEAAVGIARMGVAPGHVLHFMWDDERQAAKDAVYRRLEEAQKREGVA